ncbi:MAG TPA: PQQ-dependent sugar dehydrogenase [Chitinophagaceae bacterium]|nr:PQQ-dependent sugar dehydrogenase [Chitinophagaceae bacterium]
MRNSNFRFLFFVFVLSTIYCNKKKTNGTTPTEITTRIVKQNLQHVWEILWGPDDHIWFTEREGKISKMNPTTGAIVFSSAINDVISSGEGGLLGMALHPDFLTNGFLYVVYNYNSPNGYKEKMIRYTFSNNSITNPTTIIDNIAASSIHNGSRIRIVNENTGVKIYFTTGDASNASTAQDVNSRNGKVLRLNADGTVPADNPIGGNALWSYGHRNPQGLVFVNNKLYESEHGPSIEDEVNLIEKGRNYGWPTVNGPCDGGEASFCTTNNIKEPLWSSGDNTIAVCGIDYYNNDKIPEWKNSILMTTLKDASLRQLKLSTDGNSVASTSIYFKNDHGRLRDICISPSGNVYICTSNGGNDDKIIEVSK